MDTIRDIIYTQNKEFLATIADDMFVSEEDKHKFLKKYLKKNFSYLQVTKQDKTNSYQKKIKNCVK